MTVRPRQLAHQGWVLAHGLWVDAASLGERGARHRVLEHYVAGATVHRVGSGYALLLPTPVRVRAELAPGAPLISQGSLLSALPLTEAEREALPEGAGVALGEGGVVALHLLDAGSAVDPARWLDLSDLPVTEVFSLGHPPAPPPSPPEPDPSLRAKVPGLGEPPPELERVQAVLRGELDPELAEAEAGPSVGWWARLREWWSKRGAPGRARAGRTRGATTRARAGRTASRGRGAPGRAGSGRAGWATPPGWLGRLAGWLASALGPQGGATEPSQGALRTAPVGPSLGERLANLFTRLALRARLGRLFGARQARYLDDLFSMFERGDLEGALKHAIPLARHDEPSSGRPTLGVPSPRQDLSMDLSPSRRGGGSMLVVDDVFEQLRARYRRAFERLVAAGRVEEAAFVLADLLRETEEAVSFLEAQGRLSMAAELAEARGLPPGQVIRLWVLAGDLERATRLARRHDAFQIAVTLLERGHPGRAEALRLLWADARAERGDFAGALEVVWPVSAARHLAAGFVQRGLELGGPPAAGVLVRALALFPETTPRLLTEHAQPWLEEPGPDGVLLRQALGRSLANAPDSPAVPRLAQATARALMADLATEPLGDADLIRRVMRRAQDDLLSADAAALGRSPPPFQGTDRSIALGILPTDVGGLAVHDAVALPKGRILAALGEAGVVLLTRDGRPVAHLSEPAERLVVSYGGHRALGLARRGGAWRVARLDLVHRRASRWCELQLDAFAEAFDGWTWFVSTDGALTGLDVTQERAEATWRNRDCRAARLSHYPGSLLAFHLDARGPEIWDFELPSLTLRDRSAVPAEWEGGGAWVSAPTPQGLVHLERSSGDPTTSYAVGLFRREGHRRVGLELPEQTRVLQLGMAGPWPFVLTRDAAGCALRVLSPGLVDGGTERVRIDLLGAESARARTESEQVIVSDDRGRVLRVNLVDGRVDRSLRVRL